MMTILVVDDDRVNRDMLQSVLTRRGYGVITGTSGREALDLFREHRPYVTLVDLRMPDMDGIAVLREIRAIDPVAPVIILGGGATEAHENQARELRVTDFLRKGLSLDVLVNTVSQVVHQASAGSLSKLPPDSCNAGAGQGNSVLVVEGDDLVRDLLVRFLALRGFRVRHVAHGREAMDRVQEEAPHVIILDIDLPGINGVEVLRQLRRSGYDGAVIALTGCQSEAMLQAAWDVGLQEVLHKPVDLERLLMTVQLALVLQAC